MFTKKVRITPVQPLTLSEVKEHLNIIDFDDDDSLITAYILAAVDTCESYCNVLLGEYTVTGESPSEIRKIHLPYPPVQSVTSVKIGEDDIDYTFSEYSNTLTITDQTIDNYSLIKVVYTAGIVDANIPVMMKHAMKMIVADFYANRESSSTDTQAKVPLGALTLLDRYKTTYVC